MSEQNWYTSAELTARFGISQRSLYYRRETGQVERRGVAPRYEYAFHGAEPARVDAPSESGAAPAPAPFPHIDCDAVWFDAQTDRYSVKIQDRVRVNLDGPRVRTVLQSAVDAARMEPHVAARVSALAARPVTALDRVPREGEGVAYVALTDVHVGSRGWNGDTVLAAVGAALAAIYQGASPSHVIIPVGSDLLHVDTAGGTTTKGTMVHPDRETPDIIDAASGFIRDCVELINAWFPAATVVCAFCPGNHDRVLSYSVQRIVAAWYRNTPWVVCDTHHDPRTYIEAAGVMVMIAHGDLQDIGGLPILAATERPDMWGRAAHRYAFTGHRHHTAIRDFQGMMVIQTRAPAPRSDYEHGKGYTTPAGVSAFALSPNGRILSVTEPVVFA
jgi:hypothetical protein